MVHWRGLSSKDALNGLIERFRGIRREGTMKLLDKIVVDASVFKKHGMLVPANEIVQRALSIGGFSDPPPENVRLYYFFVDDLKKAVLEFYVMEKDE